MVILGVGIQLPIVYTHPQLAIFLLHQHHRRHLVCNLYRFYKSNVQQPLKFGPRQQLQLRIHSSFFLPNRPITWDQHNLVLHHTGYHFKLII